ncbi:MAG: glyceraldehyde 3-phosphate dehydrogenase NAD-binding domain-containing protein, partial [Pseudomonadota bacterium]
MAKVMINGLGRIGKLVLRDLLSQDADFPVTAVNDAVGDAAMHAHLL